MKQKIIKLVFASLCLSCSMITTNATQPYSSQTSAEFYAERLNKSDPIDVVIVPEVLQVKGIKTQPLLEFEDSKRAMIKFKNQYFKELEFIKSEFNLQELNDENYSEYFLAFEKTSNNDVVSWDAIGEILAFFDLYENKDQNRDIRNNLEMYANNPQEIYLEKIDSLSADYNTPLSIKGKAEFNQQNTKSMGLPNLQAAIDYAIRYAESPNYNYTYYSDGDCTNFVSQILHASGVRMDVSGNLDRSRGWWASGNTQSFSWIRADTFTRYMGRRAYYSWSSLVSSLHPGAFIATDYTGDGSVNHCAFITAKSGSYVGIAQHTDNYHMWSYETGWPTENGKRILYNVR